MSKFKKTPTLIIHPFNQVMFMYQLLRQLRKQPVYLYETSKSVKIFSFENVSIFTVHLEKKKTAGVG